MFFLNVLVVKFSSEIERINKILTENMLLMLKMEEKSGKSSGLNAAFTHSNACMRDFLSVQVEAVAS